MIHKKVINLDRNCHRLLDAASLLNAAREEFKKIYSDGVSEKNIGWPFVQPYIVDDVVVDIHAGQVVVYYHDNTPS